MQAQLFGEQLSLSSIFCIQPAPSPAARQATEERNQEIHQETQDDIMLEIEEKKERIAELRTEIEDDEDALRRAEEDELDLEPEPGDEDIFNAVAPMLEEDLTQTRYENEKEIRALECEICEMEAKLKHESNK